jgi:hypothetical protein
MIDPCPEETLPISILWNDMPSNLSSSVDPVWLTEEFALERGGIYYGSLEIIEDAQLRLEMKTNYESAIQALIQLDQRMAPKHNRIPLFMKKSDYTNRTISPIGTTGVR